jgi:glycosyltransferase involved in cell wall biosynthesis
MLLTHLYYRIKRFVPFRIRFAIRRIHAGRILKNSGDIWPIQKSAGSKPADWPGWPDEKRFALVLTHDVEGQRGLDRVKQLAELEIELGFRSSFNFVPEGKYKVPSALRRWLIDRGFEVGVHDLHHDGRLYSSRKTFRRKAHRINNYLKEWNAVGFRSGFMLRNLDWIQDLNICYDASTFDTDPFEPQPSGVGTIFPFYVKGTNGREGYVELPYTLPQDSTLFFLLKERNAQRIWQDKLDWIAECGGMALVIVHPDYLAFEGKPDAFPSYPAARYVEFLIWLKEKYAGEYWDAQPAQIAKFIRPPAAKEESADRMPSFDTAENSVACKNREGALIATPKKRQAVPLQLAGKRAVAIVYSNYPSDPRPRRAAEALAREGVSVEVICLRETVNEPPHEILHGVNITRVTLKRRRGGKLTYTVQYGCFILLAGAILAGRTIGRRFDLVHVHNMPDVLVFSALIPKLFGAKVVLDLHDPMPELMMTIFRLREKSYAVRILKILEKWSLRFADAVITVNEACDKVFSSRSCAREKITVVMNSPDEEIFRLREPSTPASAAPDNSKPFVLMYHGSLVERHGLDLAVKALGKIRKSIPGAELRIFGRATPFLEQVLESARTAGLGEAIRYLGPKNLEQIVAAIRSCDVGVIPNRKSIFTELNTPTRIFEYLSQGKLVIAPRAPGILDYFGPQELVLFELGDAEDLAAKMEYVFRHPLEMVRVVERGQEVYRAHKWSTERLRFVSLVDGLLKAAGHSAGKARERPAIASWESR